MAGASSTRSARRGSAACKPFIRSVWTAGSKEVARLVGFLQSTKTNFSFVSEKQTNHCRLYVG